MTSILIKKTAEQPGEAQLAVTVPPEDVRAAEDRALRVYQHRARLPGFRKGKAPAALVRKHYAADIREQTLQELLRESWRTAVEQERLRPVGDPHVHNLKWDEGSSVTFELHVEVRPEVKLERLGGFRLKRSVAAVTANQVEEQLNELRVQRAPWVPVVGERPMPKDLVQVTIAYREAEGASAGTPQPYQLVLGSGQAIPELEERIMTLSPGETVDTTVRFPDDYTDESKRGQARDITLTLHEVKRQQLSELNDDFAREVGDFESLEALRQAIRSDLEREAERAADSKVRSELLEQIVAANQVTAPRPLVERALAVYAQAYSIPEERWEQFAREFRPIAELQVRRDLVLDHVVEAQGLHASEEELDARLEQLAGRRGVPVRELRASLEKAKRLRDLQRSLTEEKVFAYLLGQSTVETE
jgi:trigger factor